MFRFTFNCASHFPLEFFFHSRALFTHSLTHPYHTYISLLISLNFTFLHLCLLNLFPRFFSVYSFPLCLFVDGDAVAATKFMNVYWGYSAHYIRLVIWTLNVLLAFVCSISFVLCASIDWASFSQSSVSTFGKVQRLVQFDHQLFVGLHHDVRVDYAMSPLLLDRHKWRPQKWSHFNVSQVSLNFWSLHWQVVWKFNQTNSNAYDVCVLDSFIHSIQVPMSHFPHHDSQRKNISSGFIESTAKILLISSHNEEHNVSLAVR